MVVHTHTHTGANTAVLPANREDPQSVAISSVGSSYTNDGKKPTPEQLAEEKRLALERARRTAFVARFIVLREGKRSRAHRKIEELAWGIDTTAEELAQTVRTIFKENGDKLGSVDRDIRRALGHATKTLSHFVREYEARCSVNFVEALWDYERSNELLFGHDERPKPGGWRMPAELEREFGRKTRTPIK